MQIKNIAAKWLSRVAFAAACASPFIASSDAFAQSCERYEVGISVDQVYPDACVGVPSPCIAYDHISHSQRQSYWRKVWALQTASPLTLCKRHYKYTTGSDAGVTWQYNPNGVDIHCMKDTGSRDINLEEKIGMREFQCSLVPRGTLPYAVLGVASATPDGQFSQSQKLQIIAQNKVNHGSASVKSDGYPGIDIYNTLVHSTTGGLANIPDDDVFDDLERRPV